MTERRRTYAFWFALLLAAILLCAPGRGTAQQDTGDQTAQQPAEASADNLFSQGLRYHNGDGVIQSFATAAELFTRAAEHGHTGAQNYIGRYYHAGFGVEKDQDLAVKYLAAAAQSGEPQYLYDLAVALENGADGSSDAARAAEFYATAAQRGHLPAKVSLGLLYQSGSGVEQDYTRAHALYSEAAAQGDARAQNNLGLLYVRGHGVPQDYKRAVELFEQAAGQGMAQAMTNLGVMYENGFGVELDEARAAQLYRQGGQAGRSDASDAATNTLIYDARLAPLPSDADTLNTVTAMAKGGDPVALFQLGWVMATADDASHRSQMQAARLFQAAAETGYGPAMVNLGLMYFDGRGVIQDFVQGQMWLTLAEAAGQKGAASLGFRFADVMTPSQINQAQAMAAQRLGQ